MEKYLGRVLPPTIKTSPCKNDIVKKHGGGLNFLFKRKFVTEQNPNSARKTGGDICPPSKRQKEDVSQESPTILRPLCQPSWRKISAENLSCDYTKLYGRREAKELFDHCEGGGLQYFTGELTKVQVFGKWHSIPRKQVNHRGRKGKRRCISWWSFLAH